MTAAQVRTAVGIAGAILSLLVAWCLFDSRANVPIVGPAVCAVKGGTWFEQPDAWLGIPGAGCYRFGGQHG
jgi:hypothetical protein